MIDRKDWHACDGHGGLEAVPAPRTARADADTAIAAVSRRQLFVGAALASIWWAQKRTALAEVTVAGAGERDVLVVVFLRGGADGLSIAVPYREDAYYAARPSLGIPPPSSSRSDRAIDLDGQFGLHPALAPLKPLWDAGELALVHACGSNDQTRSHFEAMNAMERGLAEAQGPAPDGWLARHLASTRGESSPLRALAFGGVMPDSLRGATEAVALDSIEQFRLLAPKGRDDRMRDALADLHRDGRDAVAQAGRETLAVLERLNRLEPSKYQPGNGARYPDSDLGRGLAQVAMLLRAKVGLEIACLDKGGWDTHVAQGQTTGLLSSNLEDLGSSLAAFARDLGSTMRGVTVVVQTEFGRRLRENTALGTDHGRGGAMLLLGGGVVGGRVHGDWPGLGKDQLDEVGDLRAANDYRDVLADVVANRLGNPQTDAVFPGFKPTRSGFVRTAEIPNPGLG